MPQKRRSLAHLQYARDVTPIFERDDAPRMGSIESALAGAVGCVWIQIAEIVDVIAALVRRIQVDIRTIPAGYAHFDAPARRQDAMALIKEEKEVIEMLKDILRQHFLECIIGPGPGHDVEIPGNVYMLAMQPAIVMQISRCWFQAAAQFQFQTMPLFVRI